MSLIPQNVLDSYDLLACKVNSLRIPLMLRRLPRCRRVGDRFSDCGDIHQDGNMVKLCQPER